MSIIYHKAIKEINPNAQFTILGDSLDGITWINTTPIANEDIEAKLSNGLLTVSLLREVPEERKPRQITLKTA